MRSPTVTMPVLVASLSVSLVAFGAAGSSDAGAANTSTTVAGAAAPTTVAPASGLAGALPPAATMTNFRDAITGMLGPTTDVAGELAPFVTPLPGIPTPEGADVRDFSLFLFPDSESPEYSYYSASLTFTAAAPAAELVTYYQNGMPAAGFTQTGDSIKNEDQRQVRWLTYDVPAPTSQQDEVSVAIVDDPDLDFVQLDVDFGLDPASLQIFGGWASDLPLVATAELNGATVSTFNFGGDISVSLSTDYDLALPQADAITQFEAGVGQTTYTLDPSSNAADGNFQLTGGDFESIRVYIGEGYPEGTSYLSITGSFDIAR